MGLVTLVWLALEKPVAENHGASVGGERPGRWLPDWLRVFWLGRALALAGAFCTHVCLGKMP